jgi:hypothetical protein
MWHISGKFLNFGKMTYKTRFGCEKRNLSKFAFLKILEKWRHFVKNRQNLSKFVKICQNFPGFFQIFPEIHPRKNQVGYENHKFDPKFSRNLSKIPEFSGNVRKFPGNSGKVREICKICQKFANFFTFRHLAPKADI